jgi:hypothetical protein
LRLLRGMRLIANTVRLVGTWILLWLSLLTLSRPSVITPQAFDSSKRNLSVYSCFGFGHQLSDTRVILVKDGSRLVLVFRYSLEWHAFGDSQISHTLWIKVCELPSVHMLIAALARDATNCQRNSTGRHLDRLRVVVAYFKQAVGPSSFRLEQEEAF